MALSLAFIANWQGWGGPAVQYWQSIPVLGNLGPVTDWSLIGGSIYGTQAQLGPVLRTGTGCQVLPYTMTGTLVMIYKGWPIRDD